MLWNNNLINIHVYSFYYAKTCKINILKYFREINENEKKTEKNDIWLKNKNCKNIEIRSKIASLL